MKVLIATHPDLKPETGRKGAELDVFSALKRLGHSIACVGVGEDSREFERELKGFKPDIVFNLLEEYRAEAVYDFHLVTRLEGLGIPFTGCNPRGLILSRNKFAASQVATGTGILVPRSNLIRKSKVPRGLKYPVFAKFNREHASLGIRESNRAVNEGALKKVLKRLEQFYGLEVLLQEYIEGMEVSLSVWGNEKPKSFLARKLTMKSKSQIATEKFKFDLKFQKIQKPRREAFKGELPNCLDLYRALDLSGYARFDFRVTASGKAYLIDINANPSLAKNEDFALSAQAAGLDYPEVIATLLKLGCAYTPTR